ncbi:hypothetical protein Vafri_15830 [Volvox africanus]|uniref:AAA+ ATPase domain-containing protein n=1 Tax=Volvox africanus TaxID=51714 RepID=A0A8J4F632_9CHLO|nr:hypothetical protein Vafri_15830 [Volvox africanus]
MATKSTSGFPIAMTCLGTWRSTAWMSPFWVRAEAAPGGAGIGGGIGGGAVEMVLTIALQVAIFYTFAQGVLWFTCGWPGNSQATVVEAEEATGVTFADVAGINTAKASLVEVADFLKNPTKYTQGVLLSGPPGCGKTLLAWAVAGEVGVLFFSISSSSLVEMFVSVGASRLRDLFTKARKKAPCIIFMDKLDAVGRSRSANSFDSGNTELDQIINELLTLMDGFDGNTGVIVLVATNRSDILDEVLTRPGHFDHTVEVELPDREGRDVILKVHLRGKPLVEDVDAGYCAEHRRVFRGGPRQPGERGGDHGSVHRAEAERTSKRTLQRTYKAMFILKTIYIYITCYIYSL